MLGDRVNGRMNECMRCMHPAPYRTESQNPQLPGRVFHHSPPSSVPVSWEGGIKFQRGLLIFPFLFCQSKSKSKIKKNNALINEKKSYLNCRVPSPSRGGGKKGGREGRFVVSVRACATRPAYQPAQACPEPA
jgi:hypothetical protein